ncbi:MAG TPA: hypothetical protein VG456_09760, partial [Candidatus Sulfopaludibacter sp.]|nr:hypothetical protein [Candidatus Sulfopaludibacter sp.]
MANHRVTPGDCFASIARANNFFNYLTLYNHAANTALRMLRTNPNQLQEGDDVTIPPKQQKTINLTLDASKRFRVDLRITKLRLVLTNKDRAALAPSACTVTVGSANSAALPGAQGLVELEIEPEETRGNLRMTFPALPAFGAPPADPAAVNPPAHPPTIMPSEFRDPAAKLQTEALTVKLDLSIGALEPKESLRGSLQRLNNLTYPTPVQQAEDDETRKSVKCYQAMRGLAAPA